MRKHTEEIETMTDKAPWSSWTQQEFSNVRKTPAGLYLNVRRHIGGRFTFEIWDNDTRVAYCANITTLEKAQELCDLLAENVE